MKKLLYTALCLVATAAAFTACSDDEGGNSSTYSQTPAADVVGTYNGTMNVSYIDPTSSDTISTDYNASAVVAAVDGQANLIKISQSAFNDQEAASAPANISTKADGSYPFFNKSDSTDLGSYAGSVKDNVITYSYVKQATVKVKNRPRKVDTTFKFVGKKS